MNSVTTYMFDHYQSGVNSNETTLKPSNVTASTFGALFSAPIDGQAYAQPLYLSNLTVGGVKHNVAYVATMHDSIYAFDADTGAQLWKNSFISASTSAVPLIVPVPSTDLPGTGGTDVDGTEVGIESTPVIDETTGTIYLVAKTKETGRGDGNIHYVQSLHALDVATGAEKFNGPHVIGDTTCNNPTDANGPYDFNIAANPQTPSAATVSTGADNYINGKVYFNALRNLQRCSLTLSNGVVYIAWASHGDFRPYHGWLVGFNASTLQPVPSLVFCDTPDGTMGGIWQGGAGPTVDNNGNLFISTANSFAQYCSDQTPGNVAESFLKFNPANGLSVSAAGFDFWSPADAPTFGDADSGIGSGGLVLIDVPGTTITHLCMAGTKSGRIYSVNRDNMGHFVAGGGDRDVQTFTITRNVFFGSPVYFNNCLFYDANPIQGLTFNPSTSTFSPSGSASYGFTGRGSGLVISANGTSDAIMWSYSTGMLKAIRPESIAGATAQASVAPFFTTPLGDGTVVKMTHPIVINGKVYAANKTAFLGFGLLSTTKPTVSISATQPTATVGGAAGTFTVTRAGSTTGNLPVTYTVSGTAQSGADYTALSGNASIPDGSASTTITVTPTANATNNSVVTVTLPSSASYTVGTPSQASVTIVNNNTTPPPTNLALNKPVTVSSTDMASNAAANAVDGNTGTRWSSQYSDPQFISIDLGASYAISEIDLTWEVAAGKNYLLQVSADNANWSTATNVAGNTRTGFLAYAYSTPVTGRYVRMYGTARATNYGYSLYEFAVYGQPASTTTSSNVALNRPVTVSSTDSAANTGANAVDGNTGTRWSSQYSDPQFISIDLGSSLAISEIDLNWETACGRNYLLQVSPDNLNWTTATTVTGNTTTGTLKYPYSSPVNGRYVRMYGTARNTAWGYSLYEMSVFSSGTSTGPTTTNLALAGTATASSIDTASNPAINAIDNNTATRWSSAYSDGQYIQVDLGAAHTISEVDLNWETAAGKNYLIQTSTDGANWTTQTTVVGNTTTGILKYPWSTPVTARYVRMQGQTRATQWGYSLYEFTILGQ